MKRLWQDSVLDALQRLATATGSDVVTRQDLKIEELPRIEAETQTKGMTTDQTLTFELRLLRLKGFIESVGRGRYRLLKRVINVEEFKGTDDELDNAIKERRLKFGPVPTANEKRLQNYRH